MLSVSMMVQIAYPPVAFQVPEQCSTHGYLRRYRPAGTRTTATPFLVSEVAVICNPPITGTGERVGRQPFGSVVMLRSLVRHGPAPLSAEMLLSRAWNACSHPYVSGVRLGRKYPIQTHRTVRKDGELPRLVGSVRAGSSKNGIVSLP